MICDSTKRAADSTIPPCCIPKFYGPPGTGKTHTIHYLASQMKDHTTLLITAEQVGLLHEYMQLARFLQPAMVVIEDVDLIARTRTSMRNPCEESLLNRLLCQKTKGGSGAFIKELMRRSAQFLVEAGEKNLTEHHVESALDEMLFSGGSLNVKLLGFAQEKSDQIGSVFGLRGGGLASQPSRPRHTKARSSTGHLELVRKEFPREPNRIGTV